MDLRAEGVALRNRTIQSDAAWMQLHHEFLEWERVVINEMRKIGVKPSDIGRFETLDLFTPVVSTSAYNELHAKDLRELSEKLRRLLEITQLYDRAVSGAPPLQG